MPPLAAAGGTRQPGPPWLCHPPPHTHTRCHVNTLQGVKWVSARHLWQLLVCFEQSLTLKTRPGTPSNPPVSSSQALIVISCVSNMFATRSSSDGLELILTLAQEERKLRCHGSPSSCAPCRRPGQLKVGSGALSHSSLPHEAENATCLGEVRRPPTHTHTRGPEASRARFRLQIA